VNDSVQKILEIAVAVTTVWWACGPTVSNSPWTPWCLKR